MESSESGTKFLAKHDSGRASGTNEMNGVLAGVTRRDSERDIRADNGSYLIWEGKVSMTSNEQQNLMKTSQTSVTDIFQTPVSGINAIPKTVAVTSPSTVTVECKNKLTMTNVNLKFASFRNCAREEMGSKYMSSFKKHPNIKVAQLVNSSEIELSEEITEEISIKHKVSNEFRYTPISNKVPHFRIIKMSKEKPTVVITPPPHGIEIPNFPNSKKLHTPPSNEKPSPKRRDFEDLEDEEMPFAGESTLEDDDSDMEVVNRNLEKSMNISQSTSNLSRTEGEHSRSRPTSPIIDGYIEREVQLRMATLVRQLNHNAEIEKREKEAFKQKLKEVKQKSENNEKEMWERIKATEAEARQSRQLFEEMRKQMFDTANQRGQSIPMTSSSGTIRKENSIERSESNIPQPIEAEGDETFDMPSEELAEKVMNMPFNSVCSTLMVIHQNDYPQQVVTDPIYQSVQNELTEAIESAKREFGVEMLIKINGIEPKQGTIVIECCNVGTIGWLINATEELNLGLTCSYVKRVNYVPAFIIWVVDKNVKFGQIVKELAYEFNTSCWKLVKDFSDAEKRNRINNSNRPEMQGSRFLFLANQELKIIVNNWIATNWKSTDRGIKSLKFQWKAKGIKGTIQSLNGIEESFKRNNGKGNDYKKLNNRINLEIFKAPTKRKTLQRDSVPRNLPNRPHTWIDSDGKTRQRKTLREMNKPSSDDDQLSRLVNNELLVEGKNKYVISSKLPEDSNMNFNPESPIKSVISELIKKNEFSINTIDARKNNEASIIIFEVIKKNDASIINSYFNGRIKLTESDHQTHRQSCKIQNRVKGLTQKEGNNSTNSRKPTLSFLEVNGRVPLPSKGKGSIATSKLKFRIYENS